MALARPAVKPGAVNPALRIIYRVAGVCLVLVPILVLGALPSYAAGTAAEETGVFAGMTKPVSESLGQAVRDMSYIFGEESNYDFLNGIFHVFIPLLLIPPVVAIYFAFKSVHKGLVTKATLIGGLSIATSAALAPFGYSLSGYVDSYALATSQAQRVSIESASGFAITTLGLGEVLAAFLMFGWILYVSWILLAHKVFSPRKSYMGIASSIGPLLGGLTILGTVVVQSWSAFFFTYILFSSFLFPVTLAWFAVMGYRLFRIV